MALTHGAGTRSAVSAAVLGDIDSGTAGSLIFRTSGAAAVATLPLNSPAGVVAAEVLTFNAITSDTNAAGGVVTNFTIEDSASVVVLAGAVPAEISLSSTTVGAGDTVSCSSLTYTAPV